MIGLIVTALLQTFCALDQEDDSGYAFHCGEADGIAAATAAFGVRALELCDDICDAYEDSDLDFMRYILRYTPDADGYSFEDTAIGEAAQASFHCLASGYPQQEPDHRNPTTFTTSPTSSPAYAIPHSALTPTADKPPAKS